MTKQLKLSTIAFAIATLGAAPAFAQDDDSGQTFAQDVFIELDNTAEVILQKKSRVAKSVDIDGTITVTGTLEADASALAITDNKQVSKENTINNDKVDNNAKIDEGAAVGASGVINVNVVAGDANAQANDVALAAADLAGVLGYADAEAFVLQMTDGNQAEQTAIDNTALVNNTSFNGAQGVLGVNVTAGNFNLQKNSVAIAASTGKMAEAAVWMKQDIANAETNNKGVSGGQTFDDFGQVNGSSSANPVNNAAHLGEAFVGAVGAIGVNISAGTNNVQANAVTAAVTSSTGFGL